MTPWPTSPVICEIHTWVWLNELARKLKRPVRLDTVPAEAWDGVASQGFDAVWLMGVWERSPAGIAFSNQNEALLGDFKRALPDFRPADNVGSPYCVRQYAVDDDLGGRKGLAAARENLAQRGLRLILDFVPNHVAPDHPWASSHPEYFVRGSAEDARNDPASFVEVAGTEFACGRDPFFPAWPDVLQLNVFEPALRQAVGETLSDIADQCDGVRCDMAMLVLNEIFDRTWGARVGPRPATEYWAAAIAAVKKEHRDFLFIAEAYWDLEWRLQQQGFDFCYDKRLYDRLAHGTAESVRLHLCAEPAYQKRLVRFIENHDEPRASAAFSPERLRAAAVVMATIPGLKLFHEGQLEGRKIRLPVFLGRRPDEPADADLQAFYRTLLATVSAEALCEGEWRLCEQAGWPDNTTSQNLVAWCWRNEDERHLIVVNLSGSAAQGRVRLPWEDLAGTSWRMTDLFSGQAYERDGDEMRGPGLYVELPPWGFHILLRWRKPAGRSEA